MHHDGRHVDDPSIPSYILHLHAEDGSGRTTSETGTCAEWATVGVNPAGRGHLGIDLFHRAPKDHLPTTLTHEGSKFCKLLLLTLESLPLPL
jgi:hypothetical protein